MFQSVQSCDNSIGAAITVAEYFDPVPNPETGDCDLYKKILILTNKCVEPDCFYWTKNGDIIEPPTNEEIMALTPIAAPTPSTDNCEKYVSRFVAVDNASGVTSISELVDYVLANEVGDGEYETLGPVDVDTDTVLAVTLMPRPEDGEDMVLIDGFQQGGFVFNSETDGPYSDIAGVTLDIPDPCNFLASICIKRCVDKSGAVI